MNTSVQQVVDTAEVEKHTIHEKMNQMTRHVEIPLLESVKKTVEVPEVAPLQFIDKVVDILVVAPRPDFHTCRSDHKVVDVPVVLVVLVSTGARSWRRQPRSQSCRSSRKSVKFQSG